MLGIDIQWKKLHLNARAISLTPRVSSIGIQSLILRTSRGAQSHVWYTQAICNLTMKPSVRTTLAEHKQFRRSIEIPEKEPQHKQGERYTKSSSCKNRPASGAGAVLEDTE